MINNDNTYFFKAFGLTIQSPIPVRGLIPIDAVNEPDINIIFEKIENYPELKLTKVKRKALTATFGMFNDDTNDAYMVWENQINFRLIDGKTMIVDSSETDLDFLSLFIVSEPLGILLFQRGDILLHASAIELPNGDGIVFMGEPGAGKSTTAAAFVKAGCKIISDDLVSIRLIDNKPYLIPSFPQIKLWKKSVDGLGFGYDEVTQIVTGADKFKYNDSAKFINEPVLLTKIFILIQDIEQLKNSSLLPIELLKYNPLPEQLLEKGKTLKKHFLKCRIINNQVILVPIVSFKNFDLLNGFLKTIL